MFGEPVRQMSAAEGWTDLNGTVVSWHRILTLPLATNKA
jgi:hypothetical protein